MKANLEKRLKRRMEQKKAIEKKWKDHQQQIKNIQGQAQDQMNKLVRVEGNIEELQELLASIVKPKVIPKEPVKKDDKGPTEPEKQKPESKRRL